MYETSLKRISLRVVEVSAGGVGSAADVIGHTKDIRIRLVIISWAEMRLADVVVRGTSDWDPAIDTIWGLTKSASPTRVWIAVRLWRRSFPRPIDAGASVEKVTEFETLAEGIGV